MSGSVRAMATPGRPVASFTPSTVATPGILATARNSAALCFGGTIASRRRSPTSTNIAWFFSWPPYFGAVLARYAYIASASVGSVFTWS